MSSIFSFVKAAENPKTSLLSDVVNISWAGISQFCCTTCLFTGWGMLIKGVPCVMLGSSDLDMRKEPFPMH